MMFDKMFKVGRIGQLAIKNRIVQAPTYTGLARRDGSVSSSLLSFYRERAIGGVGLIIVETSAIDDGAGKSSLCQLGVYDNTFISGLSTLARTIQYNGAKAAIQLTHPGRQRFLGPPIVAPSPIGWWGLFGRVPAELTQDEINVIVRSFGNAAKIVKQAGFDMLEIHGGHGMLIAQFLSPRANKRTDSYGGGIDQRMRFGLEVIDSVRRNVGGEFPISVRISGTDYLDGGITIEESQQFARMLEQAGANVLHVSGGSAESTSYEVASMYRPLALHVGFVEKIKKAVRIPVIASGSIVSPELAEQILAAERADFVSLSRPLLADPWFANKAREERPEDIIPCIRCNEGCQVRSAVIGRAVACATNPSTGLEGEFKIAPVENPKRVAVVGGGPAGMEAARVAALRGHSVTLFEKKELGGLLVEASRPEFKADLRRLVQYLVTQTRKAGVQIVAQEATPAIIRGGDFDAVILATGSTPASLNVPGLDKPIVLEALSVLRGTETGNNVVVIGGGMIGCDVALLLSEKGKKVTITTRGDDIAREMGRSERDAYFDRLRQQQVEVRTRTQLVRVIDDGVIVRGQDGVEIRIPGQTVIVAAGMLPNRGLIHALENVSGIDLYEAGDCVAPRKVYDAIHEGFLAGYGV